MPDKGFEKYVQSRFAMAELESANTHDMTYADSATVFMTFMTQVRAEAYREGVDAVIDAQMWAHSKQIGHMTVGMFSNPYIENA